MQGNQHDEYTVLYEVTASTDRGFIPTESYIIHEKKILRVFGGCSWHDRDRHVHLFPGAAFSKDQQHMEARCRTREWTRLRVEVGSHAPACLDIRMESTGCFRPCYERPESVVG